MHSFTDWLQTITEEISDLITRNDETHTNCRVKIIVKVKGKKRV